MRLLDKLARPVRGTFHRAVPKESMVGPLECGYSFRGNRYNPPETITALYFCEDEIRAPREAGFARRSCKVYRAAVSTDLILTLDAGVLKALHLTRKDLVSIDRAVPQEIGFSAFLAGLHGLRVPSALPEASLDAYNLVLFPANLLPGAGIKILGHRDFC